MALTLQEQIDATQKNIANLRASKAMYVPGTQLGKPVQVARQKALAIAMARAKGLAAKRAKVPAAQQWADSTVAAQIAPLADEDTAANKAYTDRVAQSGKATDALSGSLDQSVGQSQGVTNDLLAQGANRQTGIDAQAGKSLDFLRSVFGGGGQVGQASIDTGAGAAGQAGGDSAGLAAEIALRGQESTANLGSLKAGAQLRNGEVGTQATKDRSAALADIAQKRSDARAQIPLLVRQYQNEERDYGLKKAALQLDANGQMISNQNADADRAAQAAAQAAAQKAAAAKTAVVNPSARQKTVALVGNLNNSIASAVQGIGASNGNAQLASAPLLALGLRPSDFKITNPTPDIAAKPGGKPTAGKPGKVQITDTGLLHYFQHQGLSGNAIYYAVKYWDPSRAQAISLLLHPKPQKTVNGVAGDLIHAGQGIFGGGSGGGASHATKDPSASPNGGLYD